MGVEHGIPEQPAEEGHDAIASHHEDLAGGQLTVLSGAHHRRAEPDCQRDAADGGQSIGCLLYTSDAADE